MGTIAPNETRFLSTSRANKVVYDDFSSVDFLDHLCVHLNVSRVSAQNILEQWVSTGLQARLVAKNFGGSPIGVS